MLCPRPWVSVALWVPGWAPLPTSPLKTSARNRRLPLSHSHLASVGKEKTKGRDKKTATEWQKLKRGPKLTEEVKRKAENERHKDIMWRPRGAGGQSLTQSLASIWTLYKVMRTWSKKTLSKTMHFYYKTIVFIIYFKNEDFFTVTNTKKERRKYWSCHELLVQYQPLPITCTLWLEFILMHLSTSDLKLTHASPVDRCNYSVCIRSCPQVSLTLLCEHTIARLHPVSAVFKLQCRP